MVPRKADGDPGLTMLSPNLSGTTWKLSACKSNASEPSSDQGKGRESSNVTTVTDCEIILFKKSMSLLCC